MVLTRQRKTRDRSTVVAVRLQIKEVQHGLTVRTNERLPEATIVSFRRMTVGKSNPFLDNVRQTQMISQAGDVVENALAVTAPSSDSTHSAQTLHPAIFIGLASFAITRPTKIG